MKGIIRKAYVFLQHDVRKTVGEQMKRAANLPRFMDHDNYRCHYFHDASRLLGRTFD